MVTQGRPARVLDVGDVVRLMASVQQEQHVPVDCLEEREELSKLRPGEAINVKGGHHKVSPW